MREFRDRLSQTYQPKDNCVDSASWIPHRNFRKGDRQSELRANATKATGPSAARIEEVMDTETLLSQAREDIFISVAEYLLERYGEQGYEERLANFSRSWDEQFGRYGSDLILALCPLVEDLLDTAEDNKIVNFRGQLKKKTAKEEVRKLKARRRDQ